MVGGWWRLVAVGISWRLAFGGWWGLAVGGKRLVAVTSDWRWAVGGGWQFAVAAPWGLSLTKEIFWTSSTQPWSEVPPRQAYIQLTSKHVSNQTLHTSKNAIAKCWESIQQSASLLSMDILISYNKHVQ